MNISNAIDTVAAGYFAYYNSRLLAQDITEEIGVIITEYRTKQCTLKVACKRIKQQLS